MKKHIYSNVSWKIEHATEQKTIGEYSATDYFGAFMNLKKELGI